MEVVMSPYQSIRNCWYVIGFSHEFETHNLTGHQVAGKAMVAWRNQEGNMVVLDNRCAHKRFPLSEGRLMDDGTLECAYHGLRYNCEGQCVLIPSQPGVDIPKHAQVKTFPVVEQDGIVWVWPGNIEKSTERKPPRTEEVNSDEWESIDSGPMHVPANYLLLIENLLDITHFYPLHDGNIGDVENSYIPIQYEEGEVDGNKYIKTIREVENYTQPPFLADWFCYNLVDRNHTHCMMSPGLTRVVMRVAPPGKLGSDDDRGYVLLHTHTPIDDRNHIWRWCVNCRKDHMSGGNPNMSAAQRVASMFPSVVEEDRWALEKQQEMVDIPDEGYNELFLKPDKALRRARQIFLGMLREEQPQAAK